LGACRRLSQKLKEEEPPAIQPDATDSQPMTSLSEFLGGELDEKVVNDGPFFGEHTINVPRSASEDFPE
jgi:hypothetical protein